MPSSESIKTGELAKLLEVSGQTVRTTAKELGIAAGKSANGKSFVFTQEQAKMIADKLKRPYPKEKKLSPEMEKLAKELAEKMVEAYKVTIDEYKERLAKREEELRLANEKIQHEEARIDVLLGTVNNLSSKMTMTKENALVVGDEETEEKKDKKAISRWKRAFLAWKGQ